MRVIISLTYILIKHCVSFIFFPLFAFIGVYYLLFIAIIFSVFWFALLINLIWNSHFMKITLTFSWRRSMSYRNQSIANQWTDFLFDRDLNHERVKVNYTKMIWWSTVHALRQKKMFAFSQEISSLMLPNLRLAYMKFV